MNYIVKIGLYDSSIRFNVWKRWGRLSFVRNWIRNLLRGIVTMPCLYSSKLVEKPWMHADLSDDKFYEKPGRLLLHCYMYKEYRGKML